MDFSGIPILATAISIIISWALFAVFCSILHEAFAQVKAERGRFLKKYLLVQLNDLASRINWGELVYMHGSVDLLSRAPGKPSSEIPAATFANALVESVANSQVVKMKKSAAALPQFYTNATLNDFKSAVVLLPQSDVMTMLKQVLNEAELTAANTTTAINVPPASHESVVYQELLRNIEKWYESLMGRVELWYKKATRQRLFILGALLSLVLHVDSIQLFRHYLDNPSSRNAMMSFYEQRGDSIFRQYNTLVSDTGTLADSTAKINKRLKNIVALKDSALRYGLTKTRNALVDSAKQVKQQIATLMPQYKELDSLLKAQHIPMGWQYNECKDCKEQERVSSKVWCFSSCWFFKLLGFVISGFAASFGAPFWYDVLRKIYSVKKQ